MPAVSSLWRSPDYTSADRVRTVARITATQTALPQALKEPLQEGRRATFPGPATRKTPTEGQPTGPTALDVHPQCGEIPIVVEPSPHAERGSHRAGQSWRRGDARPA